MHKAEKRYFTGDGPFSELNDFSRTIGMMNYFGNTGRSETANVLLENLLHEKQEEEQEVGGSGK